MFGIIRPHVQPIGLDIGHDSVKMLQLEVAGGSLAMPARRDALIVRDAQKRVLDDSARANPELLPRQAAEAIDDMFAGGDFVGRKVIAALPRQIVQIKNLRLPQMPPLELANVVQAEAKNVFGFSAQDAQIEFLSTGEVRQGTEVRQEVIVMAALRSDVDRFVEQLHRARLNVESLDVEPCALYRCIDRFIRRKQDETEVHVVIDLGTQGTRVMIGRGHEISFFKSLDVGGAALNEAVSRKLGIKEADARIVRRRLWTGEDPSAKRDPVRQAVFDATRSIMESLAREVSLCMRYYSVTFRGQRPCRVKLLGGEAGDPQLTAILSAALSVPVTEGRPLLSVNCDRMRGFDNKGHSSEWALAMGLGLKRTEGRFAPMDGTPRAIPAEPPQSAQVVDLSVALTNTPSLESEPQPQSAPVAPVEEAAHA
jgi:type IV pilus assembly protein PilM